MEPAPAQFFPNQVFMNTAAAGKQQVADASAQCSTVMPASVPGFAQKLATISITQPRSGTLNDRLAPLAPVSRQDSNASPGRAFSTINRTLWRTSINLNTSNSNAAGNSLLQPSYDGLIHPDTVNQQIGAGSSPVVSENFSAQRSTINNTVVPNGSYLMNNSTPVYAPLHQQYSMRTNSAGEGRYFVQSPSACMQTSVQNSQPGSSRIESKPEPKVDQLLKNNRNSLSKTHAMPETSNAIPVHALPKKKTSQTQYVHLPPRPPIANSENNVAYFLPVQGLKPQCQQILIPPSRTQATSSPHVTNSNTISLPQTSNSNPADPTVFIPLTLTKSDGSSVQFQYGVPLSSLTSGLSVQSLASSLQAQNAARVLPPSTAVVTPVPPFQPRFTSSQPQVSCLQAPSTPMAASGEFTREPVASTSGGSCPNPTPTYTSNYSYAQSQNQSISNGGRYVFSNPEPARVLTPETNRPASSASTKMSDSGVQCNFYQPGRYEAISPPLSPAPEDPIITHQAAPSLPSRKRTAETSGCSDIQEKLVGTKPHLSPKRTKYSVEVEPVSPCYSPEPARFSLKHDFDSSTPTPVASRTQPSCDPPTLGYPQPGSSRNQPCNQTATCSESANMREPAKASGLDVLCQIACKDMSESEDTRSACDEAEFETTVNVSVCRDQEIDQKPQKESAMCNEQSADDSGQKLSKVMVLDLLHAAAELEKKLEPPNKPTSWPSSSYEACPAPTPALATATSVVHAAKTWTPAVSADSSWSSRTQIVESDVPDSLPKLDQLSTVIRSSTLCKFPSWSTPHCDVGAAVSETPPTSSTANQDQRVSTVQSPVVRNDRVHTFSPPRGFRVIPLSLLNQNVVNAQQPALAGTSGHAMFSNKTVKLVKVFPETQLSSLSFKRNLASKPDDTSAVGAPSTSQTPTVEISSNSDPEKPQATLSANNSSNSIFSAEGGFCNRRPMISNCRRQRIAKLSAKRAGEIASNLASKKFVLSKSHTVFYPPKDALSDQERRLEQIGKVVDKVRNIVRIAPPLPLFKHSQAKPADSASYTCARARPFVGNRLLKFCCARIPEGGCARTIAYSRSTYRRDFSWFYPLAHYARMREQMNPGALETDFKRYALFKTAGYDLSLQYRIAVNKPPLARLGKSTIHGVGLFARVDIAEGEFVLEYVGQKIRSSVADHRERLYQRMPRRLGFNYVNMFRIDGEHVIDATLHGGLARFINHACSPTCAARIISFEGTKRIALVAVRDLAAGDELTYDYKLPIEKNRKIACHCHSHNCKGYMN